MIFAEAAAVEAGTVSGWVVPTIIVPMAGLIGFLTRWLVSTATKKDELIAEIIKDCNTRMDTAYEKASGRLDEAIDKFTASLVSSRQETRETVETIAKHCQDEIRTLLAAKGVVS